MSNDRLPPKVKYRAGIKAWYREDDTCPLHDALNHINCKSAIEFQPRDPIGNNSHGEMSVHAVCQSIHIDYGAFGDDFGVFSMDWASIVEHETIHLVLNKLQLFKASLDYDNALANSFVEDYLNKKRWRSRLDRYNGTRREKAYLIKLGVYKDHLRLRLTKGRLCRGRRPS